MLCFNRVVWFSIVAAGSMAGPAVAHSVYVAPPSHVYHSSSRARTVVNVIPYGTFASSSASGGAMAQGPAASSLSAPVLSDEERYKRATGKTLPAKHGLIVVPASSTGDATYIWGN